jgi:hypothetical protein
VVLNEGHLQLSEKEEWCTEKGGRGRTDELYSAIKLVYTLAMLLKRKAVYSHW